VEGNCDIRECLNNTGKGVFATKPMSKGSYVRYYGLIRHKKPTISPQDILMVFGDELEIDCSRYRSKGYYVNHSCEPNSEIQF
jgi:SET domain-containing protein